MGKDKHINNSIPKDEWGPFAEMLANLIAKYADELDFDHLPDPDYYLKMETIKLQYTLYIKYRNKVMKGYNPVEIQGDAC